MVENEYDLQAVVHALLSAQFDDVRAEDYVPERAGSRSRVDFLLKGERIVVETKMTRKGLGRKEIGEELIVDIERYKAHPSCDALVGLVYDPDKLIQNSRALEADLTRRPMVWSSGSTSCSRDFGPPRQTPDDRGVHRARSSGLNAR